MKFEWTYLSDEKHSWSHDMICISELATDRLVWFVRARRAVISDGPLYEAQAIPLNWALI